MSAIKDGRYPVTVGSKTYYLLFSLNVLDEIQDKFGGYDKLDEVFNQENKDWIKNTKWLFALLLNEGMEEGETELTEKQVGRLLHTGNLKEIQKAMIQAFAAGSGGEYTGETTVEDFDGQAEGNALGGLDS